MSVQKEPVFKLVEFMADFEETSNKRGEYYEKDPLANPITQPAGTDLFPAADYKT